MPVVVIPCVADKIATLTGLRNPFLNGLASDRHHGRQSGQSSLLALMSATRKIALAIFF